MSNLPSGEIPRGAIRFNTDSNKPELWDGSQWAEFQLSTPNLGQGSDTQPGARGLIGGGYDGTSPSAAGRTNVIEYINILSTGNSINFGDLTVGRSDLAALSSSTRGVWAGGFDDVSPAYQNTIDYVTISSTGNAADFGDLTKPRQPPGGCSSSTRGLFAAGYGTTPAFPAAGYQNIIDYITIASTGNAVDFGDTTVARAAGGGGCSSPTRGIFGGGQTPTKLNIIDFVTIATLGNAQDFGDLTVVRNWPGACSNPVRGLFAGGETPTATDTIDYITIATTGNATDFGNLLAARVYTGGCASSTRGVWSGGGAPARDNVIQYVIITTQGDAVDFGDLAVGVREVVGACSNAHGGL